ncbi:L-seryl-tRNA(Sec) selenium transferase [Treponema sp.]
MLALPEIAEYFPRVSRALAAKAVSRALNSLQDRISMDESYVAEMSDVAAAVIAELEALDRRRIHKLINGTGIVLHTNLGRSPIDEGVWSSCKDINTGYSNLEFDLSSGSRGNRGGLVPELVAELVGAEAALIVNNNAAALLLVLAEVAKGKEVLVSRGELVQIGGDFRVPDILALSGAILKDVGTTNVTTEEDYLRAIGPETAAILSVNASNFILRGFSQKPNLRALAAALPASLPLILDQGSGCLAMPLLGEASVASFISAGAALVCFSCDKMLGGPQAGVIAGKADLIERLSNHPLMRAFRPGKTVLSLLEATLLASSSATEEALKRASDEELAALKARGRRIVRKLPKERVSLISSRAAFGTGTSPDETVHSFALSLSPLNSATQLSQELRQASIPIIGRIEGNSPLIDLIALADEDDKLLAQLINEAFERENSRIHA